jgi:hypothetical protein
MADRYIRRVLTVIAFALSVLAVQSISAGLLHTHAQVKAHRQCFWTIVDMGHPDIGGDGKIEFNKVQNWKRLSEQGWELKAVDRGHYIFERCEQ